MKILHFTYELVPGGAERFVVDLVNELSVDNQVALYTLRDDAIENKGFYVHEIDKKVKYINLKITEGFKPGLIWKFLRIIRRENPDVVHCHLNLVNYFFPISLLFSGKISFVYTIHNDSFSEVKFRLEKIIRRFFFKNGLFKVVAISDETKKSYLRFFSLKDVDLIYNGRSHISKTANYKMVVTEIEHLKPTKQSLVFCHPSRYNEKLKNHKMLISVFNRLRKDGKDVILLIMGEGFENAHELKSLAEDHIHFLGIKSNVTDYLFASDAFCLSSRYEGMPIALIEAFACGCVPVCTPAGGCADAITHGETGFLSKSFSEEDFYVAVCQLILQKETINKERLVNQFHERFSMERCARLYMDVYKKAPRNLNDP